MIDEGYTKFRCSWRRTAPLARHSIEDLNAWRMRLYRAGLIGHDAEHGVGFGNLSVRAGSGNRFIISGTQTGHIPDTDGRHYSLVTDFDVESNCLSCEGPVQASSEALTHAALYALDAGINAVVHVHDSRLWRALIDRIPTTNRDTAYGTPEMARELRRLYAEAGFARTGVAVMGGHEHGLISVGISVEQAGLRILAMQS